MPNPLVPVDPVVHGVALELDKGSGFDEMTALSHHFSDGVSSQAQPNRLLLPTIMEDAGFEHIPHGWWHYALPCAVLYPLVPSTHLGHLNPMLML